MVRGGGSVLLAVMTLALAGRGLSPGCRAVSTGMLGGATGAVGGAATPPQAAFFGASPFCC